MTETLELDGCYMPSEDIVAREIEGEIILVPLTTGFSDDPEALFTLNETGKAIWNRLDGKLTIKGIADSLCEDYEQEKADILNDVRRFAEELLSRRMIVKVA